MIKNNIFLSFMLIFLLACGKEEIIDSTLITDTEGSAISLDEAINYAEHFSVEGKKAKNGKERIKKVKQTYSITEDGMDLMYILNYEEGDGFLILSADKKALPILAYEKEKSFDYSNPDELPEGLKVWMYDQKKHIKALKKQENKADENIGKIWKEFEEGTLFTDLGSKGSNMDIKPTDPTPDCSLSKTREVGPFITTEWGQGCGWNRHCPQKDNGQLCLDGRIYARAGCIPVAMAQVIHHFRPNLTYNGHTFNYNIMNDFIDTDEAARLIAAAGDVVGAVYGGEDTWALPDNINNALRNLGLNCGSRLDFTFDRVKNNLFNGQPVILEGRRNAVTDWHVWVADGAREVTTPCYTYAYLHMNWGWEGDWNAWYAFADWTPDDDDYRAYKKAIVDISLRF